MHALDFSSGRVVSKLMIFQIVHHVEFRDFSVQHVFKQLPVSKILEIFSCISSLIDPFCIELECVG